MNRNTLEFTIQEAGCLLYVADSLFGGFPPGRFHEFFGGRDGLRELTLNGAVMAAALYQDDGYLVRVVQGELTEHEDSDWTAAISWKLKLESGQMLVSGVADEDLEDYVADFPAAEDGGEYDLGCRVELPPGEYSVTIYSYPPNDLSGGWLRLEKPEIFRPGATRDPAAGYEKPLDYFTRTRPGERPPAWIRDDFEFGDFLDFVIQIRPLDADLPEPEFEPDGCLLWNFRKPERCPTGIRIS